MAYALLLSGVAAPTLAQGQGSDLDSILAGSGPSEQSSDANKKGGDAPPTAIADKPAESPPESPSASVTSKKDVPTEATSEAVPIKAAPSGGTQPSPPRSRMIEEIVVTAQKREESIKDVPLSVTAYSAGALDAKGVHDASDLPKLTPGLTITTQVGFTSTFLRGCGSDAFILGDPYVATYVDGVYYPFALGSIQDFGTIDRIEVLKGPQGTLFGRNALCGAIRIITRAPSLDKPEISLQETYQANPLGSKLRAYASLPIGHVVALSVAGIDNYADSYIHGVQGPNRDPLPKDRTTGYRFQAEAKPMDWLDLRLSYSRTAQNGPETYSVNTDPSLLGTLVGIRPQDPYSGRNNDSIYFHSFNRTYFGVLNADFNWFTARLSGSHQYVQNNQSYDFDGSPVPFAEFVSDPGFAQTNTGEFQLLSNENAPLSSWLQTQIGGYYFNERAGFNPAYLQVGGINLQDGTILGFALPPALTRTLSALLGNLPVPVGVALNFHGILDTRSFAFYSQDTVTLTDWFSITGGARYQQEKRIIEISDGGLRNENGTTTDIPGQNYSGFTDPQWAHTTSSVDPKVSLNFRPQWELMKFLGDSPLLYANFQTATTSDTFNVINIYTPPQKVHGSKTYAYEAGLKTKFLDDLIDFNAAVFHYRISEPQVQVVSLLAGGAVRLENAGGERIEGADFDTTIQILPSITNGGLVLAVSGAYVQSVYTDYQNGSGFNEVTGLYSGTNNFTGHQIVRSPKWSGTVALSETVPTSVGPIELAADYYMTSKFYYLAQDDPSVEEKPYTVLGMHASFLYQPWNLRVTAFGSNILNEHYDAARFRTDFGTNDTAAPLAQYGLRASYDY